MRNKISFSIIAMMGCLFLGACKTEQSADKNIETKNTARSISQTEAIQLAENFIVYQGYTQQATNITMENVVFEVGEKASDLTKLMEIRNNLLKLPAYGARQYGDFNKWAVAFELVNSENNVGRGVSMDSTGNNISLQPKEIRLDWIDEWQEEQANGKKK